MAHPIAGVNEYRYGECGYIVNGALLKNNVKLKNIRIYKQRSVNIFDLIDYDTMMIYQYVQITGHDFNNNVIDYSKTDDEILNEIPVNTFFVRGYNNNLSITGFVIRFQNNKVCLSNGQYMFDMYVPECNINPDNIGEVTFSTIAIGTTTITGTINAVSGELNTDGMQVTLEIDGIIYFATLNGKNFIFTNVEITQVGNAILTISSPIYNTKEIIIPIQDNSDYVTSYNVLDNQLIDNNDGTYYINILESQHKRGTNIIVQIQTTDGTIYNPSVNVDTNGNITVTQTERSNFDIIIIGSTNISTVYSTELSFTNDLNYYSMDIPYSIHLKKFPSVSTYDNDGNLVQTNIIIDSNDNITIQSTDNFIGKLVISGLSS